MPSLPLLKPRELVRTFQRLGWEIARQRGSHIILTKEGHIATLSAPTTPRLPVARLEPLSQEPA